MPKFFLDWKDNFDFSLLDLKKIHIQGVDMFGPRVGFIKLAADVKKDGKTVPGIVFLRGGAVAILTILVNKSKEYTVLTNQPRIPIGKCFTEVPAGMLDDNAGTFIGTAAKEMQEETGIIIKAENLIDLTHLAYRLKESEKFMGMYPSPGGCDEYIRLFVYREEVDDKKLADLQGKCTGVIEQGELITLKVIPLEKLWQETPDSKALCCLYLYEQLKLSGDIPMGMTTISKIFTVSILSMQIYRSTPIITMYNIESFVNNRRFIVMRRYCEFKDLAYKLKSKIPKFPTDKPLPPKALLKISKKVIENRKAELEDYLRYLGRQPEILNHELFINFLTNAEVSFNSDSKENDLDSSSAP